MRNQVQIGAGDDIGVVPAPGADDDPAQERWVTKRAIHACAASADAAQVFAASFAIRDLFPPTGSGVVTWRAILLGLFAAALGAILRRALRHSRLLQDGDLAAEAPRAAAAAAAAVGFTAITRWLALPQATGCGGQAWLIVAWSVMSGGGAAALWLAAGWVAQAAGAGARVVLAGEGSKTAALAQAFEAAPKGRWRLAARVDDSAEGGLARLVEIVRSKRADMVVIYGEGTTRTAAICQSLSDQPVRVCLTLDAGLVEHLPAALPRLGDYALVDIACDPLTGLRGEAKRVIDVVLAGAVLVAILPALVLIALAIKLDSPGPVFFRQLRFGLGGRPISVIKFRTMRSDRCDATGETRTTARDPRVTALGRILRRSSIDELPQLLNVVRGDMSLVGPRPHPLRMRVEEAYYHDAVRRYRARHVVRPGITGWAQVNGSRGEVDTLEKAKRRVELDLWYLDNWSLWLDFRILVRTALGGFLSRRAD